MNVTLADKHGREGRTFRNYADALRWLADNNPQYGQRVDVLHFWMGSLRGPLRVGATYHFNRGLWTSELTEEQWERMATLQERYASFHRYLTEVAPEWKTVGRVPWMDNSVDVIQEDRHGNRRTVQETAPHGDVCF